MALLLALAPPQIDGLRTVAYLVSAAIQFGCRRHKYPFRLSGLDAQRNEALVLSTYASVRDSVKAVTQSPHTNVARMYRGSWRIIALHSSKLRGFGSRTQPQ